MKDNTNLNETLKDGGCKEGHAPHNPPQHHPTDAPPQDAPSPQAGVHQPLRQGYQRQHQDAVHDLLAPMRLICIGLYWHNLNTLN